MAYSPPKRAAYKGTITNTDRWEHFHTKPGDVFVCTPPKSGTTWTVSIVTMLMRGKTDLSPQDMVQWVDADVVPVDDMVRSLAAQNHPRCIKTHSPFDGIPWHVDASYIAVYRHPIDVMFSLQKHLKNAFRTAPDNPLLGEADDSLTHFVTSPADLNNFDADSLALLVHHFLSYTAKPRPTNLLLLHYADMLTNARAAIVRIAKHINAEADPALIDAIHQETSFDKMKSQAGRFAPFADLGYWRDSAAFFDSAGTQKWAGKLSDASLKLYSEQLARHLDPASAAWLENGDQGHVAKAKE